MITLPCAHSWPRFMRCTMPRAAMFTPLMRTFCRSIMPRCSAIQNAFPIAAYDGDKLVGFASAFMKPANPHPAMLPHRIAYIDDICVHSRCRGMGIGTLLYNETVRLAKERGADTLMLTVWAFNEGAMRFYKGLGMTERNINMEMKL